MTNNDDYYDDDDEWIVSKTDLKKAAHELREFGAQLVDLSDSKLNALPLSNELRESILTARKIKSNNALKRQLQFVGKLIRKQGADEIKAALEGFYQKDRGHEKIASGAENWRDKLLEDSQKHIGEFIERYPDCNRQKLNQLVRAATKELQAFDEDKPDKNSVRQKRALFVFLRDTMSA